MTTTKRWMGRTLAHGWGVMILAGLLTLDAAGAEEPLATLEQTSAAFSDLAERSMPAVVSIRVMRTVEVGGQALPFNNPFDFFGEDFMRRFFPGLPPGRSEQPRGRSYQQQGSGSGFIISQDGYILSNNHVVGDADEITVKLNDGREFQAERIGTDPKSEVALIKIDGDGFPVLPLGDSSSIRVGQWVIAIGNPFGLAQTLTVGVVSAKGRSNIGITDYEDFIQTDAAINPGNSGGPLLNVHGEAVGINTAIYSRSGGYMGIGFAIPVNMAKYVKDQLIEQGRVIRSYLGVVIQLVTAELAGAFGLDEAEGILVSHVAEGTGAADAGIKAGDVILAVDGDPVKKIGAFRNRIAAKTPGTDVLLTVYRDGESREVEVTTGEFPSERETMAAAPSADRTARLGLSIQNLSPELAQRFGYEQQDGVIISQVEFGSAAAQAGLQPGMLITSVNRTPIASVADFRSALAAATEAGDVLLHVSDRRGSRFVVIPLG